MKKIVLDTPEKDGYEAVIEELLEANNQYLCGTYLVQLGVRYSDDNKMDDITEVFCIDSGGHVEWMNDWWEGQHCITILGFAPIEDIDITKSFPFHAEEEN